MLDPNGLLPDFAVDPTARPFRLTRPDAKGIHPLTTDRAIIHLVATLRLRMLVRGRTDESLKVRFVLGCGGALKPGVALGVPRNYSGFPANDRLNEMTG
jgi:hypothetical protein